MEPKDEYLDLGECAPCETVASSEGSQDSIIIIIFFNTGDLPGLFQVDGKAGRKSRFSFNEFRSKN